MPITSQQLLLILPNAGPKASIFVPIRNTAMGRYQIVGSKRVAAFIAWVGHESGQLIAFVESLNYSTEALQRVGQAGSLLRPPLAFASRSRSQASPRPRAWATARPARDEGVGTIAALKLGPAWLGRLWR